MIYEELSKENPFGEPSDLEIEEECQLFHLTHKHDGGSNNVLDIIVDLLFEAQLLIYVLRTLAFRTRVTTQ